MTRKEAIRALAATGAGVAAAVTGVAIDRRSGPPADPTGEGTRRALPPLDSIPVRENEDVLLRMQRELRRAMAKPVEQRRWVMVIDLRKCVGCHACTIACVAENKLPPGVVYRPVTTEERGSFPNVHLKFTPRPCMQCENPSCTPVCPVKATWKRPDGVVAIDYDRCIGCRYCLTACPYGARTSDFGDSYRRGVAEGAPRGQSRPVEGVREEWDAQPAHEYAKHWVRANHRSPVGNARKCHFCLHRLEGGMLPMCVTSCIGRATYFGDARDPESLVVELITKNNYETLLPHRGTRPQVFYLT